MTRKNIVFLIVSTEDLQRRAIKGFTHYKTTATDGIKQLFTTLNK